MNYIFDLSGAGVEGSYFEVMVSDGYFEVTVFALTDAGVGFITSFVVG